MKTDEEAVSSCGKVIRQSKFSFVQLHSMEYLLKATEEETAAANAETTTDPSSSAAKLGSSSSKVEETAALLDSQVCRVVEACPAKSVVFVVCGSSDIRRVRRIQQQSTPDLQRLRREVMLARTGCVLGFIVN